MLQKLAYVGNLAIITIAILFFQGCSSSSETTLVGDWERVSDFDGYSRGQAVGFTIGTNTYICSGSTDRERYNDLWEFNLTNNYWEQKADLPGVARNSAVGFAINSKGYLTTGYDGVDYLSDTWEYDPASDSWTQKDDFGGTGRYEATAFAVNNKGYVTCGYDGHYLKDVWQFNPTATSGSQWTQKASIGGSKRTAATSFVYNNKAYVISGNNNGSALNDLWVYDDATDSWTAKRKISNVSDENYDDDYSSITRYDAVAIQIGTKIYLATGSNGSLVSTVWEYDPATDLWEQKTGFEGSQRQGAIGFSLNSRGFIITGQSGSSSFDNCYEFHPDADVDDANNI